MNNDEFFEHIGVRAGQARTSWVFRNGLFVADHKVASYRPTDINGKDLLAIAEKTRGTNMRIFVFSEHCSNYFIKTDGFDHRTEASKERYLLGAATIGFSKGSIFIVKGERANDPADQKYLPPGARSITRDEFKELMAIA